MLRVVLKGILTMLMVSIVLTTMLVVIVVLMVVMPVMMMMMIMIEMTAVMLAMRMRPVVTTAMMITEKDRDCCLHVDTHGDDTHMYVRIRRRRRASTRRRKNAMIYLGWKPLMLLSSW